MESVECPTGRFKLDDESKKHANATYKDTNMSIMALDDGETVGS